MPFIEPFFNNGRTRNTYLIFKNGKLLKFGDSQVLARHINDNLKAYMKGYKAWEIINQKILLMI